MRGTRQTIQKNSVGFSPWENTEIPWDVSVLFFGAPNIFHNFVSFHPILMFLTILESGDKTNNIGDEFKTIRLILINTYRYLVSFYSFSEMKTYFGL